MLDDADIEGWRDEEAALRSVRKGLPRQPTQENHFAALPYADVPALVTRPKKLPDTAGRDALLFTILNAVRSGETRPASWPEIDLKGAAWTIPPARMTMSREHVVPLSGAAVSILKRRWALRGDDEGLIFSTSGRRTHRK